MIKTLYLLLAIVIVSASCAVSPLRIKNEARIYEPQWTVFLKRIETSSGLSTDGKTFYFGSGDGNLFAVSTADLKQLWRKKLDGRIEMRPLISGDHAFVGTSSGTIYALSVKDGSEIWKTSVPGQILGQPTLMGDHALLIGANDGALYAFDVKEGKQIWKYARTLPDRITVGDFAAPIVIDNVVYASFSDGSVVALQAADGKEVWRKSFSTDSRFPDIVAPLAASGKQILVAQFYGEFFALNLSGQPLWSIAQGGSGVRSLVSGDNLVVPAAGNQLFSVDVSNGQKKWTYTANETATWSGISVFKDMILAATFEGSLYVVEKKTGTFLWKYVFGASIQGAPLVVNDRVWILSQRGTIYSLKSSSSHHGS